MNKNDYVNRISGNLDFTKKEVSLIIDEFFKLVCEDLKNGEKIMITNFGSFETSKTKPFNVYSPYDGKLIEGLVQTRVHFKSSNGLKKFLNDEE